MNQYFTNNDELEHNIKKVNVTINDVNYFYYTDNGVFSKSELDFGTQLLLQNLSLDNLKKEVLDIGCGCGPISIFLSKKGFNVDATDVNERAISLCKKSTLEQKLNVNIYLSDAYQNINKKYDYIISNPPIRVGKKILYEILMNAKKHLNKDGELWLVVRKKQGADTILKDLGNCYSNTKVIIKKKGYYVIKCS